MFLNLRERHQVSGLPAVAEVYDRARHVCVCVRVSEWLCVSDCVCVCVCLCVCVCVCRYTTERGILKLESTTRPEREKKKKKSGNDINWKLPGNRRIWITAKICMYVHTCYVLINPPMPIYYVLAAVFASCFYVLKSLLHEWGHIFYYVRLAVFASCFYVLFKNRFVREATKGGPFKHLIHIPPSKAWTKIWALIRELDTRTNS